MSPEITTPLTPPQGQQIVRPPSGLDRRLAVGRRRFFRSAGLALVLTAACASGASAAPSFRVDEGAGGETPDLAIDSVGTARVAWTEDNSSTTPDPVRYCVIARGAKACSGGVKTLPALPGGAEPSGTLAVRSFLGFTAVMIQTSTSTWAALTLDDTSFGAWAHVSNQSWSDDAAIVGPDLRYSFAAPSTFQSSIDLSDYFPKQAAALPPGFPIPTAAALGLDGSGRPVHVSTDGANARWRRYSGPMPPTTFDLNDDAVWTAPQDVGTVGDEARLASGPSGLFLLMNAQVTKTFGDQMRVRRFNGSGWDPPVDIAPEAPGNEYDLYQSTNGRLYAIWREDGAVRDTLRISTSGDGGASWTSGDLIRDEGDGLGDFSDIEVAAAPDARGFAVWAGDLATTTNANNDQIRMSTLDLLPPASSGGADPAPTPPPASTPPAPAPAGKVPVAPSAGARTGLAGSAIAGDIVVQLFAPSGCVSRGERLTLRVTSKARRRLVKGKKSKAKYKIVKVTFALDKVTRTDKKAPFAARFSTTGLATGAHSAKAKVTVVKTGSAKRRRALVKTLKVKVKAC